MTLPQQMRTPQRKPSSQLEEEGWVPSCEVGEVVGWGLSRGPGEVCLPPWGVG